VWRASLSFPRRRAAATESTLASRRARFHAAIRGRDASLPPSFNYYYGKPGDICVAGETIPGWSQNVLDFALGITFH
jgi:hypothetical protein